MPKRYAHLKPYVATIKKVVQMGHSEFTDAVKADIDWDKKQFAFTSFNTVLKNHPTKRVFIEFDYSQIELYILAMMADVRYMLKVINEGKDLHSMTAALTMNKSYEYYMDMTKQEKGTTRHDAKTMNFTFSFLGSAHSAQQYASKVYGIVKATEFWQDLEERFHTQYNEIRPFAYTAFRQVMETGVVTTITGHTRRLDEEHSEYFEIIQNMYNVDKPVNILDWVKTIPYNYKSIVMKIMRKAVNTQIQGSANSYTALSVAMNYNYIKENKGFPNHIASTYPLGNKMPKSVVQHNVVHDAQYVSCEIQDLVATIRTYNEVMTIRVKEYIKDNFAYETNIPLGIGCTIGDSWYGMFDFHIDGILKDGTFVVAD
jgi:DNA polymerase I-like protein with 3'-5' exonuclease and polymerase domains